MYFFLQKMISRHFTSSIENRVTIGVPIFSFRFASSIISQPSLYDRLGLQSNASLEEIKKTYKQRALKCHPDVIQSSSKIEKAQAESEFRGIAEAYETLSNEKKRQQYDRTIRIVVSTNKTSTKSSTPTTSKKCTRSSSSSRSSFTATRRTSSQAKTTSSSSSPFLSKDAQRIFREAFEGKSVHDVLFSNAFKKSKPTATSSSSSTSEGKSSTKKNQQQQQSDNDERELWEKYMNTSREELKRKFKEKHPFADPKDYAFGLRKSHFLNPDEPPAEKFPFRPCPSLKFPDHIHPGDEVETMKVTKNVVEVYGDESKYQLEGVSMEPTTSFKAGEDERGEFGRLTKDPEEYVNALKEYTGKSPANEGMVWSFRRQY